MYLQSTGTTSENAAELGNNYSLWRNIEIGGAYTQSGKRKTGVESTLSLDRGEPKVEAGKKELLSKVYFDENIGSAFSIISLYDFHAAVIPNYNRKNDEP
jgi:hypothetical protein